MVGRENEKEKLLRFLAGKDKACLVYGLRRIGKSYLIQNTLSKRMNTLMLKNLKGIYYTGEV